MQPRERVDYLLAEARRHDPDRYLTALFAPADRREAVLALILLHHELAKVPEVARQPMAGYIRYQWWRDALDEIAGGRPPRDHPVVVALAMGIGQGRIAIPPLQAMIDAREQALDQVTGHDLAAIEAYAAVTAGRLQRSILDALGPGTPSEAEAAGRLGTAIGLIGMVRALAQEAALPRQAPAADLEALTEGLLARADRHLAELRQLAGRPPRARMAAFLPARLVGRQLRTLRAADSGHAAEGGSPQRHGLAAMALLALLWAYLRRRP